MISRNYEYNWKRVDMRAGIGNKLDTSISFYSRSNEIEATSSHRIEHSSTHACVTSSHLLWFVSLDARINWRCVAFTHCWSNIGSNNFSVESCGEKLRATKWSRMEPSATRFKLFRAKNRAEYKLRLRISNNLSSNSSVQSKSIPINAT